MVYRHLGTDETWARPIENFLSQVDREKYPDARQKHRFEVFEELTDSDGSFHTESRILQKPLKSFTLPAVMYENLEPGRRNENGVMVLPDDD